MPTRSRYGTKRIAWSAGLYGLAIGKVFFGELQFSVAEHASKVALIALHRQLAAWGYRLRDGKWMTPHLASFGFKAMKRDAFKALLDRYVEMPRKIGPMELRCRARSHRLDA